MIAEPTTATGRVHVEALTFHDEAGPFRSWCACHVCVHLSARWCEAKGCPCCTQVEPVKVHEEQWELGA